MMKIAQKLLYLAIFGLSMVTKGYHEYIYPVASIMLDNMYHIYLIHQTSSTHLELLLWNPVTKETQKVLLSRFTPAGLQVLPGQKGFSFIDHDTFRVKLHHKRSPQLLDFDEPLYDFTVVSWIDDTTGYFSACNNTRFAIYEVTLQGHCDCLLASSTHDCLYPQKIQDDLFYIERDTEGNFRILCTPYISLTKEEKDQECYINNQRKTLNVQQEYQTIYKEIVLDLGTKNIAFLHMIHDNEGFFLEHPRIIEKNDETIFFVYHYFYRNNTGLWESKPLFNFFIPSMYLVNKDESRLYESILPLLPRYISERKQILFVDSQGSTEGLSLDIWLYDMKTKTSIPCVRSLENQSFFGSFFEGKFFYYGGKVVHDKNLLPRMWLAKEGFLYVDLPSYCFD